MLIKQLFSALRSEDALEDAFQEFAQMLKHAQWMFERANAVIRREARAEDERDALYERDQRINALLRSVRGRIVRHLTINPGHDVAASLALMSIAKDAERIGDYCKNVFEVGRFYREEFHVERYHEPLEEIRRDTEALFSEVERAFRESDVKLAREIIAKVGRIRQRCDHLVEQLLRDDMKLETHEAVAYSLLARHNKRVAAHVANICTALLGRVEDLDFKP